ncbi:glycosyltransferase family 4 protein [Patescibacteria group bacterium]|nr:glycosyltransferase family 4 protein [Patescibacteria group bacterium]
MRIAHLISTFPPYTGGMGNTCLSEVKGLVKLGHRITVFTPGSGQNGYYGQKGFEVKYLKPLFKYGNAAFVPQITKELNDFDLIHLHWPFIGGAEKVLFWKKFNKPKAKLIIQYHMDLVDTGWRGLIFKVYNLFFNSFFINQAEKILVSSLDYIRHSKIKKFLFQNQEKFIEFPIGVDLKQFFPQPKNQRLLEKYNLQADDKLVLFVGGLDRAHYFKGVPGLIKAWAKLKNQYPKATLLIVGEGELKKNYQKLARDLGIDQKIIFAGRVKNQDLPQYYNLADIFVLPSTTCSEAFGLVSLEAMACAKPIIVSNLPGPRTLAENNGLIVRLKDVEDLSQKLDQLLKNETLAQQLGQTGRRRVEQKYNWSKIVEKLNKIYDEVGNN